MSTQGRYLRDVLTMMMDDEDTNHLERSRSATTRTTTVLPLAPFLAVPCINSSHTISTNDREIQALKQKVAKLKEERERIQRRKQETLDSYGNLLNQYEYGLNSIQKLSDLSVAPDNVMNGNQGYNRSF